jgi:hypothetical protein
MKKCNDSYEWELSGGKLAQEKYELLSKTTLDLKMKRETYLIFKWLQYFYSESANIHPIVSPSFAINCQSHSCLLFRASLCMHIFALHNDMEFHCHFNKGHSKNSHSTNIFLVRKWTLSLLDPKNKD